jgi:hypothetical protein
MQFTHPLDSVRIASPCSSDWNAMYGNERMRFCSECKLNVYNLSEMTKKEAENFLMSAEGRVCMRIYRRKDGTVLTKDCPVGWQAIKRRTSKAVSAAFSIVAGFFGGIMAMRAVESAVSAIPIGDVPALESQETLEYVGPIVGEAEDMTAVDGRVDLSEFRRLKVASDKRVKYEELGRVEVIEKMEDKEVVAWIP